VVNRAISLAAGYATSGSLTRIGVVVGADGQDAGSTVTASDRAGKIRVDERHEVAVVRSHASTADGRRSLQHPDRIDLVRTRILEPDPRSNAPDSPGRYAIASSPASPVNPTTC
jgi:hypothetical protein